MSGEATREEVAAKLRKRILRGLRSGTLEPGDRLPSAREAGEEFGADHRVVLAAYGLLADEGLVELRERSGIYVARRGAALHPTPGVDWLVDILVQGLTREVPIVELHEWIHRAIGTKRLRAIVIDGTRDQIAGICRELREDFGLDATGIAAASFEDPGEPQLADLAGADLLVTTKEFGRMVRALGKRVGVDVIIAEVGPDLLGGDWRALLRKPLYLLVSEEGTVESVRRSFAAIPDAAENLRIMVVGRDDVAGIPKEAAVYVSRGAADALGGAPVGGHQLPRARGLSWKSAREIIDHIVHANFDASAADPAAAAAPVGRTARPRIRRGDGAR
jgi:DNA-binding transcriptional regulator YhcF (GntR family)